MSMSAEEYNDIYCIALEIRQYLDAHPNAADSLEGIVRWWLPRQRYEEVLERVQSALDLLITEGMISKVAARGNKIIYSNIERQSEGGR